MSASFSVTNNYVLRQFYAGRNDMITDSDRKSKSVTSLNDADSGALRRSLISLAGTDRSSVKSGNSSGETRLFDKLRAFTDAYNNTVESGGRSQNDSVAKLTSKIKKLSAENSRELSRCGISLDGNGYMSISEDKVKEMTSVSYDKCLGKGADYNKSLTKLVNRLTKHIDYSA